MSSNSSLSSISHGIVKNGTGAAAAAAAAAKDAQAAKMALQQLHNQRVPGYYALSIGGLILVFTIFHWSHFMYNGHTSNKPKSSTAVNAQVGIARYVAISNTDVVQR
jgi:hypothetical protein